MSTSLSWEQDQASLTLHGSCCASDIPPIWAQLKVIEVTLVDLEDVSRIDSAGIAAIITAFTPSNDSPLRLKNCSWQAKQLLTLYGLEDFIELA